MSEKKSTTYIDTNGRINLETFIDGHGMGEKLYILTGHEYTIFVNRKSVL